MNINKVFYPESIAVIGASTQTGSVGNSLVKNLIDQKFSGKLFPVNPKTDSLYGMKCYKNIMDIEGPVDMAIFAIPAAFVPLALEEAGKKGIKSAIIISAGFKEIGLIQLENQIKEIGTRYDIAVIGPNCLGVITPEINMNASFSVNMPDDGNVAFISQSGALCTAVIDYAKYLGIGFSKFVSMGNKACISELEMLKYLANDPKTKVILLYIEQLTNPVEIINTVKYITHSTNPKPVIAIKAGRTNAGAAASASHTGALSGDDSMYEALFNQCGIIRANSISELFDFAEIFSNCLLPDGKNVAIVTNAGGPGVLTTDEIIENGLNLSKFSNETKTFLTSLLPPAANKANPVDVLGDAKADRYSETLKAVVADDNVDGVLVILTPQAMTQVEETAKVIIEVRNTTKKPIVATFMGQKMVLPGAELLKNNDVTTMSFPESAANAMAILMKFAESSKSEIDISTEFNDIDKQAVSGIFSEAKANGQLSFNEKAALEILRSYNFPLLRTSFASTANEAKIVAEKYGTALAMKIASKDILHKSDVGGVILNVTAIDIEAKFDEMMKNVSKKMPTAKIEGVLLMEMAPTGGHELILGSIRDPNLGSMIMVGLGGIYVEVFKDVSFGVVPLTKIDAEKMIDKLKSKRILDGVRGQPALDKSALVDCMLRLSQLINDFPEIKELDVNPLRVMPSGQGVIVLDARIVID